MKKLLITGFDPFDGATVNPSWEAVKLLPEKIGDYFLYRMRLPVLFGKAARDVIRAAEEIRPDVILCVGQAGGRDAITPELVGINLRYASIPDNGGEAPMDEAISEGGENAYFSTLPVRKMVEAINEAGIPAKVSYSAGAYVCNDVLYTLLERFHGSGTRVGFIHIPYSAEQGKAPSMELEKMIDGLAAAIAAID